MPLSHRALNRLQTGGNSSRARDDRDDVASWKLQYYRKDCVSDGDSDGDSDDDSDDDINETKPKDDCHVLIRWSQIKELVKQRMACVRCGTPVTTFN
jgi:hypothetical protein